MFDGHPGAFAVVLEEQDVAEAMVIAEVADTVAEGAESTFDGGFGEVAHAEDVVGGFDDDFVGSNALHAVEEAFTFAVEVAFDAESGVFVGNDAKLPAWGVGCGAVAVGENLAGCVRFVTCAERAEAPGGFRRDRLANEVGRTAGAIGGDDYPAVRNGVFAKFRHEGTTIATGFGVREK
jgi:hypothetical protein